MPSRLLMQTSWRRSRAHEKHTGDFVKHAREYSAFSTRHSSLKERLDYCEKLLGDSSDKHARELSSIKDQHARHIKELQDLRAAQSQHASLSERVNFLEKAVGDSADKHQDLEKHAKELEALKALHARHASKEDHASMKERITYLERLIGDSAERHARELAATKEAHEISTKDLKIALSKIESMHNRMAKVKEVWSEETPPRTPAPSRR